MTAAGGFVNEITKAEKNSTLITLSVFVFGVALAFVFGIYLNVFKKIRKNKK